MEKITAITGWAASLAMATSSMGGASYYAVEWMCAPSEFKASVAITLTFVGAVWYVVSMEIAKKYRY